MNARELFQDDTNEWDGFKHVTPQLSSHPDLHGLLLLERLGVLRDGDAIGDAQHDIWYPNVDETVLDTVITPEIAQELRRSGFHWDTDCDCLAAFS